MNENTLRQVENKLNSKYYATNNMWLRDCVEYYLSEHNNPRDTEVLEFVVSQWQLSDLREISNEKPCLPRNLASEKCTTLQGHFILQMEKVYDISESKFKQLEKIRDHSNENEEVTEAERTQTAWEPKNKRMLQLHLTDGAQDVIGIEYKPIRFLSDTLLPGYKLLIKGPVTCRQGVIMLDETSIEGIGGEVANLLVPNALENVLARALNLPENPDPYGDNEEIKMEEQELFNDDFDIDIDDVAVIELEERGAAVSTTSTNQPSNSDSRRDPNIVTSRDEPATVSRVSRTESDLLFDEIDDVIFDESELVFSPPKLQDRNPVQVSNMPDGRPPATVDLNNKPVASAKAASASNSGAERNSGVVSNVATMARPVQPETKPSPRLSSETKSNVCPTSSLSRMTINNETRSGASSSIQPNPSDDSATNPLQRIAAKRTSAVLSPPGSNSPAEKMRCPKSTSLQKIAMNNRKITDFIKKAPEPSSTARVAPNAYDSIRDILNATSDSVVYKTIKGKVTKFDNLSKNGQSWQLNATITDCTGSIDTTFSSEILESMLGFSVADFSVKKKLKKTDPNMEAYLRQGFRRAEKKLSQLDDVMELELVPNQKPKVIRIKSNNDR